MLSGTGVGSLLFRDVRTAKGYVYGIDSSISIGRTQSTFSISFSADPKNARKAQAEAVAVVRQLQATDVPLETLQSAKAVLLAEQVLPLASYSGVAGDMLEDLEIGYSQKQSTTYWNALLNTTPAQIRAAMRKWIDTKRFTRVEVAPGN
jgi:predicted Zn-dependent peptidase